VNSITLNPGWTTGELGGRSGPALVPADEGLHPVPADAGYAWTETSYWGFTAPDHDLMAEIYIWYHPALKVMSAGVLIWRGLRASSLAADYVNHHHFLPLPDQIGHYRIDAVGLEIEILDPLRSARLTMKDPERGVAFDVVAHGQIPPVSRPNGHHLVQPMHVTGTLDLYGETIPVDGHFMRDRSWGAERHETPRDLPPITWMTGMAQDFSFHLVAFDDPALDPDWKGRFAVEPGQNLVWGYLHKDGVTSSILKAAKRTRREADGVSPRGFDLTITDGEGRELVLRGEVTARVPWNTWQNVVVHYSLTRWDMGGGRVAWGDCQDIHYNRYVHEFSR